MSAILLLVCFLALTFAGIPIAVSLGLSSLLFLVFDLNVPLAIMVQRIFTGIDSFPIMAIPSSFWQGRRWTQAASRRVLWRSRMPWSGGFAAAWRSSRKTNTHEIALGVTGNNPHFSTARNPWNTERIPGGSSSGSAIAVATGMALGALGTDTGGSIRIPASLCGVVGFKPTYGRVSLRGVFPLSWNLDHVGPLASCVRDAALIMQVTSVYDPLDPASIKMLTGDFLGHLVDDIEGRKIVLATGDFVESATDPEVLSAIRSAARVFESLGCKISEVNTDWMREAALANAVMTRSDGAAVHRDRLQEHPEMFGDPSNAGKWLWGLGDLKERPLFHAPEIRAALMQESPLQCWRARRMCSLLKS